MKNSYETVAALREVARVIRDRGTEVGAASPDLKVHWISAFIDDVDDLDDDFILGMEIEFEVKGKILAKVLGKQQRVVDKALRNLNERDAPRLLRKGPGSRAIMKELDQAVKNEMVSVARNHFSRRGAKVTDWDWGQTDYWSAEIKPNSILFKVEIDVQGEWK